MHSATQLGSWTTFNPGDTTRRAKPPTFPIELLEPFDFHDYLGRRVRCGVAHVRVFRGVSVIVSEPSGAESGNPILHSYDSIATQLHRERLPDVAPWNIQWFARYLPSSVLPESFYQVRLEWVSDASPRGEFKRPRWRTLLGLEALRLVQTFDKEVGIRSMLDIRAARTTLAFERWSAYRS